MVCLLLLAYVGQSLAAITTPCAMMDPASSAESSTVGNDAGVMPAGMDHSGHYMTAEVPAGVDVASNCCDGGLCSMSHCLAVAAILPAGYSALVPVAPAHGSVLPVFSPFGLPTSLYRPPISR